MGILLMNFIILLTLFDWVGYPGVAGSILKLQYKPLFPAPFSPSDGHLVYYLSPEKKM